MVVTGEDASMVEDVDDDLTRELAFYNQVQRFAPCNDVHLPAKRSVIP